MKLLFLLLAMKLKIASSKVNECRAKFFTEDWQYCTKFGSPANSKLRVQFKSRLMNY